MSTFDRLRAATAGAITLGVVVGVDCGGASGDCFRYSDCSPGLTCAAGKCVAPPPPGATEDAQPLADGGTDGSSPFASDGGAAEATLQALDDAPAE